MIDPSNETFALISNNTRESNILIVVVVWCFVIMPLIGFLCWRAIVTFGPNAASVVGAALGLLSLVFVVFFFVQKRHYTLTFTPELIQVTDKNGQVVESLNRSRIQTELAYHMYVGRASVKTLVLIIKDDSHEITLGPVAAPEPQQDLRHVSAPVYLLEQNDFSKLLLLKFN